MNEIENGEFWNSAEPKNLSRLSNFISVMLKTQLNLRKNLVKKEKCNIFFFPHVNYKSKILFTNFIKIKWFK